MADNAGTFARRCEKVGLSAEGVQALSARKYETAAAFFYAVPAAMVNDVAEQVARPLLPVEEQVNARTSVLAGKASQ